MDDEPFSNIFVPKEREREATFSSLSPGVPHLESKPSGRHFSGGRCLFFLLNNFFFVSFTSPSLDASAGGKAGEGTAQLA